MSQEMQWQKCNGLELGRELQSHWPSFHPSFLFLSVCFIFLLYTHILWLRVRMAESQFREREPEISSLDEIQSSGQVQLKWLSRDQIDHLP